MRLEHWNNELFAADVKGESIINGYHCANNGWKNLFTWDNDKWAMRNLKNFSIFNFAYKDPVNYYYPLIAGFEIYLATMGGLEDLNSLYFSVPRATTSLFKAIVVSFTDTY